MDIALIVIGTILVLVGILGSFLPVLPWPFLSYIALILLRIVEKDSITIQSLIIRLIVIIIITILDYVIPIIWTKKMWWTKRWTRWATIGLIVWMFVLPILSISIWPFWLFGIIWWPFFGALIWEKLNNNPHALRAAFGSFLWFLAWTLIKLVVTIIMAVYFFQISYDIILQYF